MKFENENVTFAIKKVPKTPKREMERTREFFLRNPLKLSEYQRRWASKEENKEKIKKKCQKRYLAIKRATPSWFSEAHKAEIEALKEAALHLTIATGIAHEVDHCIPLQGHTVCGLNLPINMRVVPAKVNQQKANKLIEIREVA